MAGASPATTILPCATQWRSRTSPCIVVAGLAPAMVPFLPPPFFPLLARNTTQKMPNFSLQVECIAEYS